jgi:DNA repair protein RecN (Recombination protein N)
MVEVHGQRDGHALLKKDRHRQLVDSFAGIVAEVSAYGLVYTDLGSKRKALAAMASSEAERQREMELLRFAAEEIDAAGLRAGEEDELLDEERRLSQHEKLYASVTQSRELLSESDGAITRLRKARAQLEAAGSIDPRLVDAARRLDDAYYEIEDIGEFLTTYVDQMLFDPARLEFLEGRLAVLQRLKRKYGASLDDVIAYRIDASSRLDNLENWEEGRAGLEEQIAALEADVKARAEIISAKRIAAAKRLEETVQSILGTLGMPHARFKIRIERLPLSEGKVVVGPNGVDELEFHVAANKGEPLRPLADVASGGELSRVMLALKTALADDDGSPTMVFDEIDAGIGGEVALGVGLHLAGLASTRQVLCITHLASIAARADNHFVVEKKLESDRTVTRVSLLTGEARVREIARMLSGDSSSRVSLDHAANLVARLGSQRGR